VRESVFTLCGLTTLQFSTSFCMLYILIHLSLLCEYAEHILECTSLVYQSTLHRRIIHFLVSLFPSFMHCKIL
jgi:hypothetical protein